MKRFAVALSLAFVALAITDDARAGAPPLRVGSKRFTESYILAEAAVALAARAGDSTPSHQQGLGGTALLYRALEESSIDLYPEYTGTIVEAILHETGAREVADLRAALAPRGIGVTDALGFDDTYAIAVTEELAAKKGLHTIDDAARDPSLRFGVSQEFLGRSDGWRGLRDAYGMRPEHVDGLDHGLAYEALRRGAIDATDVYSTDANIARYRLVVLADTKRFFPRYQAVFLYRLDAAARSPGAFREITKLAGAIDERAMIAANARAEIEGASFDASARRLLADRLGVADAAPRDNERRSLASLLVSTVRAEGPRHLGLVLAALVLAILVGVPLGVVAAKRRVAGVVTIALASVVQTIPSLALLCFLIPLLGTGAVPALVALFLYGLLPIVRNTMAGLEGIPRPLLESAEALGLSPRARLIAIELPLASRTVLAGIKTSAVVNVGTATLAAFIGAGGFGAPISVGLNLNDTSMILAGAIPAAALALAVEGAFALLDRLLIPRGLRLPQASKGA